MATFLDLFAGCGGFSIGLKQAGLRSVGEIELDNWAAESLRFNFGDSRVIEADIRNLDESTIRDFSGVDVIVGGPPCQGFSVAGSSQFGIEDPRNDLVFWFLHWVEMLKPRIAIIENVPNILTKSHNGITVFDVVKQRLTALNYSVEARILNSGDFGTPQLRRRAFIVASEPEIKFKFPEPTHHEVSRHAYDLFNELTPYITVGEAISDLPLLHAGQGNDAIVPYALDPQNEFQRRIRTNSQGVANHIAMKHSDRLIERFKVIGPGQSLKDVPLEHGQIAKFTGATVKNPFKYNNYRLDPNKPSLAIPASFQSLFLHPAQHRNLTAREAARIMGFPDTFIFQGKRTTMSWEKSLSQYNQIGNAVCPPVAAALGQEILKALSKAKTQRSTKPENKLLRVQSHLLTARSPLPTIRSIVDTDIAKRLLELGQEWVKTRDESFLRGGFRIPLGTLPAAIIFSSSRACNICSNELAPFCCHDDEMAFLISKDDIQSLRDNENDHGLDYHIRAVFDIPHQVGHLVGEMLAELNLASLEDVTNHRTGRRVRGIKLNRSSYTIPNGLDQALRHELSSTPTERPVLPANKRSVKKGIRGS